MIPTDRAKPGATRSRSSATRRRPMPAKHTLPAHPPAVLPPGETPALSIAIAPDPFLVSLQHPRSSASAGSLLSWVRSSALPFSLPEHPQRCQLAIFILHCSELLAKSCSGRAILIESGTNITIVVGAPA